METRFINTLKKTLIDTAKLQVVSYHENFITKRVMNLFLDLLKNARKENLLSDVYSFINWYTTDTEFCLASTRNFISLLLNQINHELYRHQTSLKLDTLKLEDRDAMLDVNNTNLTKRLVPFHELVSRERNEKEQSRNASIVIQGSLQSDSILSTLPPEMICAIASEIHPTLSLNAIDRRFTLFKTIYATKKALEKDENSVSLFCRK